MLRSDLTVKGRVFLVVGTLCVSVAAAGTAVGQPGAHPALFHFGLGALYGLGVTLNVASWYVGRVRPG